MTVTVSMPQLGESVTEGTVTRWLKKEGERVEADEPLLEVSTDKVDTEIPSPVSGILRGITVAEDETVAVGAELAVIETAEADGGPRPARRPARPRRPARRPGAVRRGARPGAGQRGASGAGHGRRPGRADAGRRAPAGAWRTCFPDGAGDRRRPVRHPSCAQARGRAWRGPRGRRRHRG